MRHVTRYFASSETEGFVVQFVHVAKRIAKRVQQAAIQVSHC